MCWLPHFSQAVVACLPVFTFDKIQCDVLFASVSLAYIQWALNKHLVTTGRLLFVVCEIMIKLLSSDLM